MATAELLTIAGGGYQLRVDGEPFFIKGAGLEFGQMALLAECGGNTFRTWRVDNGQQSAEAILDEAAQLGLKVCMGLDLARERHGFDYRTPGDPLGPLGTTGDPWGPPGDPFGNPWGPPGDPLGTPGDSWGTLGTPGHHWGPLGTPWGPFWEPLGTPGDPCGPLGTPVDPWGPLWTPFGHVNNVCDAVRNTRPDSSESRAASREPRAGEAFLPSVGHESPCA